jgi:hypothetical protein
MKNVIATALIATLGFAGAASAMVSPHVDAAQEMLETYDFDVDASKLSSAQVSSLALLSVDSDIQHPGRAEARAKNSIRAILK